MRPSLSQIYFTTFVYTVAQMIVLSPDIVLKINKIPTDKQLTLSHLTMATTISQGIISVISSKKIGQLSDKYGRRSLIIMLVLGSFVGKIFLFQLLKPASQFHFKLIVLAEFTTQFFGGPFTLISLVNAYITDLVSDEDRVYYLGIGVAALFAGMSIGPLLGNLIVSVMGNVFDVLYFNLGLLGFLLVFVCLFLGESKKSLNQGVLFNSSTSTFSDASTSKNDQAEEESLADLVNQSDIVKPFNIFEPNFKKISLLLLIEATTLSSSMTIPQVIVLYSIFHHNWTSSTLANFIALAAMSKAITLLIMPIIIKKAVEIFTEKLSSSTNNECEDTATKSKEITASEKCIILFSIVVELISVVVLCLWDTTSVIFLSGFLSSFGSMCSPVVLSVIVRLHMLYNEEMECEIEQVISQRRRSSAYAYGSMSSASSINNENRTRRSSLAKPAGTESNAIIRSSEMESVEVLEDADANLTGVKINTTGQIYGTLNFLKSSINLLMPPLALQAYNLAVLTYGFPIYVIFIAVGAGYGLAFISALYMILDNEKQNLDIERDFTSRDCLGSPEQTRKNSTSKRNARDIVVESIYIEEGEDAMLLN